MGRYSDDWELLTATSNIILTGRLKILWEYVILGRKPLFTIEAWVSREGTTKISGLKLFVTYNKTPNANTLKE